MPNSIALVVTDLEKTRLGLTSRVGDTIGEATVLAHTVSRVAQVRAVRSIVLVHPQGQRPMSLLGGRKFNKPINTFADPGGLTDSHHPMRRVARAWSLTAWRGGIGGAGCYDELLPAAPLVVAMDRQNAQSALLVGADWPLIDPDYCQQVLERHLANPEAMAMTFTQAPPGLAGCAIGRGLLDEIARKNGLIGQVLSYNPTAPQPDPIGRDVCIAIDPPVRSCDRRFIYDTARSVAMIDAIEAELGPRFGRARAKTIAQTVQQIEPTDAVSLPQQITLELTPQRTADGPITPQHHVRFDREPMSLDVALRVVEQMGADDDIALTLGGLGDALLHEHWPQIVNAAHNAGVLSIAVQTDLLVDEPTLEQLVASSIDVISVRLNADTARLYHSVMGIDRFAQVAANLEWLLQHRRGEPRPGLPWVVPHLIETGDTLGDMEPFFDRWTHFAGSAVIQPAATGCGLAPAMSPVGMAPPRRRACRQIQRRMTILSDATVAQCDQDWLGREPAGDAATTPLAEIWQSMNELRQAHQQQQWDRSVLCGACVEWHRP